MPFSASGGFHVEPGRVRVNRFVLDSGESTLALHGGPLEPEGIDFSANIDSLARFSSALGGAVAAEGNLSLHPDTPKLTLALSGQQLDLGPLAIGVWQLVDAHDGDDRFIVLRTPEGAEPPNMGGYRLGMQIELSAGDEISVPVPGPEEVLSFAAGVVQSDPSKAFVLKADSDVPYRYVDSVIDALKQAKAQVIYLLSDQETVETGES